MTDLKKTRDHANSDRALLIVAYSTGATIERDTELENVSIVFATGQKIAAKNSTLLLQKIAATLTYFTEDGAQS